MTEEEALVEGILEAPEDDVPRLILADWLEDRGDARGQFIRVQCWLARLAATDTRRTELLRREQQLLKEHRREWAARIEDVVTEYHFVRGFVEEITMDPFDFRDHGARLTRLVPLRRVLVDSRGYYFTTELAECVIGATVRDRIVRPQVALYPLPSELLPESIAREFGALPLDLCGNRLRVAMSAESRCLDWMRLGAAIRRDPAPVLVRPELIVTGIDRHYSGKAPDPMCQLTEDHPTRAEAAAVHLRRIVHEAIGCRAAAILLEPFAEWARVRFSRHEVWEDRAMLPLGLLWPTLRQLRELSTHSGRDHPFRWSGLVELQTGGLNCKLGVDVIPGRRGHSLKIKIL